MSLTDILTSMPSLLLFLLVVAMGMLATRAGAWLGRWRAQKGIKEGNSSTSSAVAAMLGLLAFMLAFTFSITSNRFADRKRLVVTQANALGTSYLRTSMIPGKQKLIIRNLFREYVHILLGAPRAKDINKELEKLAVIRNSIWEQTSSLTQEPKMDSELRALFVSSVNSVIDLESERMTVSLIFRIPPQLWVSLLMIFFLSMLSLGYQADDEGLQRHFNALILSISFALVIALIADMDSLGEHSLRVSQKPLEDLLIMMRQIP